MDIFWYVVIFFFGASIGSFLNVVIWRLPQQLPLTGRSFCPNCKHQLAWYDLIPLFSVIWRKFSCGYCKLPISYRYIIIETIVGFLFFCAYYIIAPVSLLGFYQLAGMWFIISIAVVVFVIDYEHYLILDKIVWPSVLVMLLWLAGNNWLVNESFLAIDSKFIDGVLAGLMASGFFGSFWLLSKGRWMGFGDVKFAIFMGLALGVSSTLVSLFLAFMLGSICGVVLIVLGKKELSSKLPFGTFLTVGMVLALFFGDSLANAYLSLIGL